LIVCRGKEYQPSIRMPTPGPVKEESEGSSLEELDRSETISTISKCPEKMRKLELHVPKE